MREVRKWFVDELYDTPYLGALHGRFRSGLSCMTTRLSIGFKLVEGVLLRVFRRCRDGCPLRLTSHFPPSRTVRTFGLDPPGYGATASASGGLGPRNYAACS